MVCCRHTITRQFFYFFFFNDTATTEIYTLSLHDALPISRGTGSTAEWLNALTRESATMKSESKRERCGDFMTEEWRDRKSTRLNSSHLVISYAVFCLKKKNKKPQQLMPTTSRTRLHTTL